MAICSNCEQMKRENKVLRESLVEMGKLHTLATNENLKLKALLTEMGVYWHGHLAEII